MTLDFSIHGDRDRIYRLPERIPPIAHLTPDQQSFLKSHSIAISDGYVGMLRAYCDNRTVWQTSSFSPILKAMVQDKDGWDQMDVDNRNALSSWVTELMSLTPNDLATRLDTHVPLFS